jgi:hypothetical protein
MTKMLKRHRHFGKLRDPEDLVVRVSSAISRISSRNFGVSRVVVS